MLTKIDTSLGTDPSGATVNQISWANVGWAPDLSLDWTLGPIEGLGIDPITADK